MTNPYQFDDPDEVGGGARLNPADIIGHLLLVWAVDYIPHSVTKFTKADKPSDVIVVDVVDLDLPDENGYAGLLAKSTWWRQARLIGALRQRLDNPRPVLVHMALGQATIGLPPYELHSANGLPDCVARAQAWMAANPNYQKSLPRGQAGASPSGQPAQPAPLAVREPSLLERLASQAAGNAERVSARPAPVAHPLPPPPPPAQAETPPF